ncbi:MAG: hypothetical protein KC457_07590, partial [Myxococcales bacterium]|nr:hypothetical protein [Myxococcales bacterium]
MQSGEECDEGAQTESCNADCTLPRCGDGVVRAPEACDPGDNEATEVCDPDCSAAECGDGVLNERAGEQCDTAGPTALCTKTCTLSFCGDGIVNNAAGELCDYGVNGPSNQCPEDCGLTITLETAPDKQFMFSWVASGAEYYETLWLRGPEEQPVGVSLTESLALTVPLFDQFDTSYVIRSCFDSYCLNSAPLSVSSIDINAAIGTIAGADNVKLGRSVVLSADG